MKLLTPASYQTKLRKSEDKQTEYAVYSVSLSPADSAGTGKTNCPSAVKSCIEACVGGENTGLAKIWPTVMQARIRKTLYFQQNRAGFLGQLHHELEEAERRETENGRQLVVRLNAFSDIVWERFGVPQSHPEVCFYDYTKLTARRTLPENYRLTYSWTGTNAAACLDLLASGENVAVVFAQRGPGFCSSGALRQRIPVKHRLPGSSQYWTCYDGDASDIRWSDPDATRAGNGRICALRLKSGSLEHRARLLAENDGFIEVID
jgi:hypothetical protein